MAKQNAGSPVKGKKKAVRKKKDMKMRRSVMGTLSLLLMLTAVIVALIPVPKAAAVVSNDVYTTWNDSRYYINDATCPTENWFTSSGRPNYPYCTSGMHVYSDGEGLLRVSNDPANGGVIVAFNEESSPQSSLSIPEQMPAYRYNGSAGGYVAADADGRFLYYYSVDAGTGSSSFVPCLYDASAASQAWEGQQVYAFLDYDGKATDQLTSYSNTSVSNNSLNVNASSQLVIPIKYIGMPDVSYHIALDREGDSQLNVDHPDGYWETLSSGNYKGVFEGKNITDLTIPATIVAVGDQAFMDCRNLNSVSFSDQTRAIGNMAFKGCISLSTVDFISGGSTTVSFMEYIGDEAFSGCTNLGNFALPTSVTTIGNFAFCNCKALTSPDLVANGTSSLQTIGNGLFYGCESLTQLALPSGTKLSGYGNVNLPDPSDNAVHLLFYGCSNLQDIELPRIRISDAG